MNLMIVESPAKAKTINKYLGDEFKVIASFGHVRDLPAKEGSVIPSEGFSSKYIISEKSRKYVEIIIDLAKDANSIYLATDPDREGESISWHISEVIKEKVLLKPNTVFKRIVFYEITKKAVLDAINNPRSINMNLVNAQQARRSLDYLFGFNLSPLLWRKLPACKSAGRVQSVALRLVYEREEEIRKFVKQEYWSIKLNLLNQNQELFEAILTQFYSKKVSKNTLISKQQVDDLIRSLQDKKFLVLSIDNSKQKHSPPTPFTTSTLQQEAANKLGFNITKTMQVAQKLYEGVQFNGEIVGLITYIRTDSLNISLDALSAIKLLINKHFGKDYVPLNYFIYASSIKNAQEAHESIRPTDINIIPEVLHGKLDEDLYKLYNLIWKRTIACQMKEAITSTTSVKITSLEKDFHGKITTTYRDFDGFSKVYSNKIEKEEINTMLKSLREGDQLELKNIIPIQHFTNHPPRYSEASLVKKLEQLGIGRPSTYVPILSVLKKRMYVNLNNKSFFIRESGRLLIIFLTQFFSKYVEYNFTAKLEERLDSIAEGKLDWKFVLNDFWQDFYLNIQSVNQKRVRDIIECLEKALTEYLFGSNNLELVRSCSTCFDGRINLKFSKFGAFLACSNYPKCNFKKSIEENYLHKNQSDESAENNNKMLGNDVHGSSIYLKKGPYGWYLQAGEQIIGQQKPKRVKIPTYLSPQSINLQFAEKLLNIPFILGKHNKSKEEIVFNISRYGFYIKYLGKSISIPKNLDVYNFDINKAIELINNYKNIK